MSQTNLRCPDCNGRLRRPSRRWKCRVCHATGTLLNGVPTVISRYRTFGRRLNPYHPERKVLEAAGVKA